MTLTGRNITIRGSLLVCLTIAAPIAYVFVSAFVGWNALEIDMQIVEFFAVIGAFLTVVIGFLFAALFARLFRRSPSIPVFFVTFFFLAMTFDISKIGQVIIQSGLWPQFSLTISRIAIFGHITGVLSLFAAGLYSGGVRMQKHGTVIIVGVMIALSLSTLLPVDSSTLPEHLVYPAGVRASFEAALIVILVLSIVNFLQAAIVNQNPRLYVTTFAVVLLAVGREALFYSVEPIWIIVGGSSVIIGGVLFTGEHYRDYLIS